MGNDKDRTMKQVRCPLCLKKSNHQLYKYSCDAGLVLGRIEVINVMCDNCGFVYFNPRPTQKLISDHYQFASSGTTFHENTALSRSNILTHERIDFIIKHISPLQCGKLIDIGCGSGDLLRRLDMPSWEKFGLDPTQKAAFDEDSMVQFQKGKICIFN